MIFTTMEAVNPPSSEVAVIVTVPSPTAVTTPFSSTVAMVSSLEDHVTFLFVVLAGVNSTSSFSELPYLISVISEEILIP